MIISIKKKYTKNLSIFEAMELAIADEIGLTGDGLLAALEANPREAAEVLCSRSGQSC